MQGACRESTIVQREALGLESTKRTCPQEGWEVAGTVRIGFHSKMSNTWMFALVWLEEVGWRLQHVQRSLVNWRLQLE
jgi:hypothetical protein